MDLCYNQNYFLFIEKTIDQPFSEWNLLIIQTSTQLKEIENKFHGSTRNI